MLVAGDANLDVVLRGHVRPEFGQVEQLIESADVVIGSSAGITACGLASLDVNVTLAACVGGDLFGHHYRHLLSEKGVDTSELLELSTPTGLSVILSEPNDRAILTLLGALAQLDEDDVMAAMDRVEPSHLHIAALYLLPTLAPAAHRVFAAASASGVTTSMDTNWDPTGRWDHLEDCLPHLDVFLPNAQEAFALAARLGRPTQDVTEAARTLAALGPAVAVKNGAAGGVLVMGTDVYTAPVPTVDVIDSTGAGDSFNAGFLAAWTDGLPPATCLAWATHAGSLATRAVGGTGSQADRATLMDSLAGS